MTRKKLLSKKSKMTLEKLGRLTQQGFLGVEGRLTRVENNVRWMKNNFSELFTKLDKFIALYEKQEQELLVLGAQLC